MSEAEEKDTSLLALPGRVARLKKALEGRSPYRLAENTGAIFEDMMPGEGQFQLALWEKPIVVTYPTFIAHDTQTGKELSIDQQALLLFYFDTSQGAQPAGRWISFSELPEGKFYNLAYQGYTGNELARFFKRNRSRFEAAAQKLGGLPVELGQAAYAFQVLPKVLMLTVYWEGDEDFPSSFQVLFDAAVIQHLPTDVCAIVGGMLTRRIIKNAPAL
jgi:hypothetical protein